MNKIKLLKFSLLLIFPILTVFLSFSFLSTSAFAANPNLVPNPGLEIANGKNPANWNHKNYGNNTAKFTYNSTGGYIDSKKDVKLTVSNYVDGGVSWYSDPVSVVAGETYTFGDVYKSTVWSYWVIELRKADGTISYQYLDWADVTSSWTVFSRDFTIPAGIVSATLIHEVAGNGSLTTDSYFIIKSSLTKPLITLTFDDGYESIYQNALPVLQSKNLVSTQYIVTGFLDTPTYMTTAEAKAFLTAGHELASHTVTHPFLTTLTNSQITAEMKNSKQALFDKFGVTTNSVAIPYDDFNSTVQSIGLKYYSYIRTSEEGLNNLTNFQANMILSEHVELTTPLSTIQGWIDEAKSKKQWLVIMYHQVDNAGGEYSITPANFATQMDLIKNSGVTVKTFKDAVAELASQL